MAGPGYSGYFLGGLASGLESGFNMGMQINKLKWQKEQQKKIDDLNKEMSDAWSSIGEEMIALTNDGYFSADDELKIQVLSIAGPYQMQGELGKLRSFLSDYRKRDFDRQMEYIKTYIEYAKGLDPKDVDSAYKTLRDSATDPHVLALLEVADKKLKHEVGVAEEKRALDITGKLPTEYKYPYLKEKGIVGEITPTMKEPAIKDYSDAWNYLYRYKDVTPETFNKVKPGFQRQFPNIDMTDITQEALKSGVKPITEPTPAPTSTENIRRAISDADTVKDAQRIYKNYADKYDEKALGIDDLDKFWAEGQTVYLNNIKTAIGNIIDEKGWLKKGTLTSAEVGFDFKGEQSVEEIYEKLREEYMKYRAMLEKLGIDISQFPELKPLEEIEKVGLGEGFWGWGKQRGQYKSIYR